MISAYSKAYQLLGDGKYLNAGTQGSLSMTSTAKRAAHFIREKLYNPTKGTLIRNYRLGPSNIEGFTDDYSFLIAGLLGEKRSCHRSPS